MPQDPDPARRGTPPRTATNAVIPWSVHTGGALGALSAIGYLVDAALMDLFYIHPFTLLGPLLQIGVVLWMWVSPGRRRWGRILLMWLFAYFAFLFGPSLGSPFLVLGTIFLALPTRSRGDGPAPR